MIRADTYSYAPAPVFYVREQPPAYSPGDPPSEAVLQEYWKQLRFPCEFKTLTGEPVTVLDGGRHNTNAGPDFINGIISLGGEVLTGAIEIHRQASGWNAHRHGGDLRFRNVILHVLGETPRAEPRYNNTAFAPKYTIVLHDISKQDSDSKPMHRCRRTAISTRAKSLLWQMGLQRLTGKADRFHRRINAGESSKYVWLRKTLRCLGYGQNADRMESLADTMDFDILLEISHHCDHDYLFQIALGLTGYHRYWEIQVPAWESLRSRLSLKECPYYQWRPLRTRPANHPVLRLYLLLVHGAQWYSLYSEVPEPTAIDGIVESLQTRIAIPDQFYEYFGSARASLGKSRAVEMLVNAWIPLWCRESEPYRMQAVQSFAEPLPVIPVYAVLQRFIETTGWAAVLSDSRLHPVYLQGMLHLRRRLCKEGACERCPMVEGG